MYKTWWAGNWQLDYHSAPQPSAAALQAEANKQKVVAGHRTPCRVSLTAAIAVLPPDITSRSEAAGLGLSCQVTGRQ